MTKNSQMIVVASQPNSSAQTPVKIYTSSKADGIMHSKAPDVDPGQTSTDAQLIFPASTTATPSALAGIGEGSGMTFSGGDLNICQAKYDLKVNGDTHYDPDGNLEL